MSLKLYCNRYAHFKDPLVCSVVCPYRTKCQDFALYYDNRRAEVDDLVARYYAAHGRADDAGRTGGPATASVAAMRTLIRLEVKREMAEATYIWIDKDEKAELLGLDEIIQRAERGAKARNIYKIAQEMELRFQLVPRQRIEKAKRTAAAEADRAVARRKRNSTRNGAEPAEASPVSPVVAPVRGESPAGPVPISDGLKRRRPRRAAAAR